MRTLRFYTLLALLLMAGGVMAQGYEPIFEDFETGDFSQFEWQTEGQYPWTITNVDTFEGSFCIKCGNAGHPNTLSAIQVCVDIPEGCVIANNTTIIVFLKVFFAVFPEILKI